MKNPVLILLLAITFFTAYGQHARYQPKGLRKLTDKELIERTKKRMASTEGIVFKDRAGKVVAKESVEKMDWNEWTADQYVDSQGKAREFVLRKMTTQDRELRAQLQEALEEPITLVAVDCSASKTILEKVYQTDQGNRQNNAVIDSEVDRKNQQIVVSLIEKCGFPAREEVGKTSVDAAFLVIQHASPSLRRKYFPLIKQSADKGDLNRSLVALMEDRMLMETGKKQKYGSQVTKKKDTDPWQLYPIEDPSNVNKRRAEIGLGPIEEYLKNFQINYRSK